MNKLNKSISCKNLFEQKLKTLQIEQNKRMILMQKDLKNCYNIKIKKLNIIKKEEEQKKSDILKEKRNKEREDIIKRNKKNNESLINIRKYINEKPKKDKYIYIKNVKKYEDKEYNLIKQEKLKRKMNMKPIDGQELANMEKSFQEYKDKQESELKEKTKKLKQEWSNRQKLLPLYVTSISKKLNDEKEKNELEKELKLKRIIDLKKHQMEYSNNVPVPNKVVKEKIKDNLTHRNQVISNKNKNKNFNPFFVNSINYSEIIRKQIVDANKKRLKNDDNKSPNKSEGKQKDQNMKKNIDKRKQNKVYDYLTERRIANQEKNKSNKNTKEIKFYLKNNGINDTTLDTAKYKLEKLDEKKRQKDLILKYNGGISKNLDIGEELCDIMIDSINARISVIEEMDNNLKDNKNNNDNNNINNNNINNNNINNNNINNNGTYNNDKNNNDDTNNNINHNNDNNKDNDDINNNNDSNNNINIINNNINNNIYNNTNNNINNNTKNNINNINVNNNNINNNNTNNNNDKNYKDLMENKNINEKESKKSLILSEKDNNNIYSDVSSINQENNGEKKEAEKKPEKEVEKEEENEEYEEEEDEEKK